MALTRIKNAALDPSTDITADQLDVGQLGGRRNLIINGAMQVWQRGTSGLTASGEYTADRWWMSGTASVERSTDAPEGFSYSLKVNTTSANTFIGQPIELVTGSSSPMIAGETVTLSFYAKTATGTDSVGATISFRDAKFSATNESTFGDIGSKTITTAWQRFTGTLTVPNINATNVLAGLVLYGIDGDIYITGVQLEVGSVATPFEHRSYGEELSLCQRYYQTFGRTITFFGCDSNNGAFYWQPTVSMRTNPTMIVNSTSPYWESNPYKTAGTSLSNLNLTRNNSHLNNEGGDILVSGTFNPTLVRGNNYMIDATSLALDAEL